MTSLNSNRNQRAGLYRETRKPKSSMIFLVRFHKFRASKLAFIAGFHTNPNPISRLHHREVIQNPPCDRWFAKVVCTLFCFQSHCLDLYSDYLAKRITPLIAFEVVRKLNDNKSPNLALRFFEFSRVDLGLVHTFGTYSYLLRSLCQMNLLSAANSVLDWMLVDGHSLDYSVLGFLVSSFAEAGEFDIARKLLSRSDCVEMGMSSFAFNKFLNILVKRNRVGEAVNFFHEQMLSKSCFDACTFNILIRGLCRAGQVDKASKIFEDMNKFGLFPDIFTYNTMIDGFCRVNELDKACKLLMALRLRNDISPDVVTYTSIISGYCKLGEMVEAFSLYQEMMSAGIRPSIVTFNILIDGFGKVGDMASSSSIYEKMLFLGCLPDVVTFTSRIDGYCRMGQVDEALKLWQEMVHRRLSPNKYTFSILIIALCKENRVNEACDFLGQLKVMDIIPQPFMYNPVIDGLCKAGKVDEAKLIVCEMEERRCKPDKYTFTILIIGHCMKGRMLDAINIFNKMIAVKCTPDDITIKSLLSCLLKAGMPHEASQIKKNIALEKVELDLSSSRTSIVGGINVDIQVAA